MNGSNSNPRLNDISISWKFSSKMDPKKFQGEGEAPQNPDLLTRRIIFDNLTSKLSPTASTFVGEVMELVCQLHDVTQGMYFFDYANRIFNIKNYS